MGRDGRVGDFAKEPFEKSSNGMDVCIHGDKIDVKVTIKLCRELSNDGTGPTQTENAFLIPCLFSVQKLNAAKQNGWNYAITHGFIGKLDHCGEWTPKHLIFTVAGRGGRRKWVIA